MLVTDPTVVVVVVVAVVLVVALPPVAFSALVRLIGFALVLCLTFSALCTRFRRWTALVVAFSLATDGFTVTELACVVWPWPCAVTLDEVTECPGAALDFPCVAELPAGLPRAAGLLCVAELPCVEAPPMSAELPCVLE